MKRTTSIVLAVLVCMCAILPWGIMEIVRAAEPNDGGPHFSVPLGTPLEALLLPTDFEGVPVASYTSVPEYDGNAPRDYTFIPFPEGIVPEGVQFPSIVVTVEAPEVETPVEPAIDEPAIDEIGDPAMDETPVETAANTQEMADASVLAEDTAQNDAENLTTFNNSDSESQPENAEGGDSIQAMTELSITSMSFPVGGIDYFVDNGYGYESYLYLSKSTIERIDGFLSVQNIPSDVNDAMGYFKAIAKVDDAVINKIGVITKIAGITIKVFKQLGIQAILSQALGEQISDPNIVLISLYLEAFKSTGMTQDDLVEFILSLFSNPLAASWKFITLNAKPNFSWNYVLSQGQNNGVVIPVDSMPFLVLSEAKPQTQLPFTEWNVNPSSMYWRDAPGYSSYWSSTGRSIRISNETSTTLTGVKVSITSGSQHFRLCTARNEWIKPGETVSIGAKQNYFFSIVPADGLPAGVYEGTATIETGNGNPRTINIPLSFTVKHTDWSVDPVTTVSNPIAFPMEYTNYGVISMQVLPINIHNNDSTYLYGVKGELIEGGEYFRIMNSLSTIWPQSSDLLIVYPEQGLTQGIYKGTVRLSADNGTPSKDVHFSLTVNSEVQIIWDANGGTVTPETSALSPGAIFGSMPTPTRTGYSFEGWYTQKTGGSRVDSDYYVPYFDTTYCARWRADQEITVTVFPEMPTVERGATKQFSAQVRGTMYTSVTWLVDGIIGEFYPNGTRIDNNGLLYVHINEKRSTLTVTARLNSNMMLASTTVTLTGGNVVTDILISPPDGSKVQRGTTQQMSAQIVGIGDIPDAVTWSIEGTVSAGTSIDTNGLLTVAADETSQWLSIVAQVSGNEAFWDYKYTSIQLTNPTSVVVFSPNGGTRIGGGALVQQVKNGEAAEAPVVERTGYTFDGWDVAFDNIQNSITVTAQWTATTIDKTLISITAPSAVTDVENGTAKTASALGLPATVTMVTNNGNVQAGVTWDVGVCSYNPLATTQQTFTVSGTAALPSGVTNPNSVSLNVTISVTVNAAGVTANVLQSVISPSAITGVANGAAKTASTLGLPATVTMVTNNGSVQAGVTWNVASCSYNPATTTQQTFTVSGTAVLPSGVTNPNSVSLNVTISVTVTGSGTSMVTGVSVSPATATVQKGSSGTFTATVQGTNNPSQAVSWSVGGNNSSGTTIIAGVLTVAANETATSLTVRATSIANTAISGTAAVTVTGSGTSTVTGVSVSPATATIQKGSAGSFTATVQGTNNPSQAVSWSISGNNSGGTTIIAGVLTVAANETATSLTVRATSTANTGISGTAVVTVTEPGTSTVTGVSVSPATATVQKGSSKTFTATVQGTNNPSQAVTWSVSGNNSSGTNIANGLLTVATSETAAALTVRATSTANTGISGTAVVTMTGPGSAANGFANGSNVYRKGSWTDLVHITQKDFPLFSGIVDVNGVVLTPGVHFSASSGSTRTTLKAAYLETLTTGTHMMSVYFTDGEIVSAPFTVAAESGPSYNVGSYGSSGWTFYIPSFYTRSLLQNAPAVTRAPLPASGTIISKSVAVRDRASSKGKRLGTLRKGEKVTVVGFSGSYTKIDWNGQTAYVLTSGVEVAFNVPMYVQTTKNGWTHTRRSMQRKYRSFSFKKDEMLEVGGMRGNWYWYWTDRANGIAVWIPASQAKIQ